MKKMLREVAMVGLMLGFALGAHAEDTVKIGMLSTLSGPFEFVGRIYVSGAKFAVDEQNAKGGLLGKKIGTRSLRTTSSKPMWQSEGLEISYLKNESIY